MNAPAGVLSLSIPAADEYRALRRAAGLSAMGEDAAARGLPASWASACIREGATLIGMGRVVGDGGCFLFVVDVAVHPDHQRQGWGRRIMAALMDEVHGRAPPGAMIGLIADGQAHRLYELFGFKLTAPAAQGMLLRLPL